MQAMLHPVPRHRFGRDRSATDYSGQTGVVGARCNTASVQSRRWREQREYMMSTQNALQAGRPAGTGLRTIAATLPRRAGRAVVQGVAVVAMLVIYGVSSIGSYGLTALGLSGATALSLAATSQPAQARRRRRRGVFIVLPFGGRGRGRRRRSRRRRRR